MYLRGDSVQLVGAVWLFKLFYVLVIFAIMALTLIISTIINISEFVLNKWKSRNRR